MRKNNRRTIEKLRINNEFSFVVKKYTHMLIEKTKTTPQETLEFTLNKQMETFLQKENGYQQ